MSCDDVTPLPRQDEHEQGSTRVRGSTRTFRSYNQAQMLLMPVSLDDWLPDGHVARLISEVVDELLDLSAIYDAYAAGAGAPPYDPAMMLKLLLYGYSTGVTSSREMERRCVVDVAFRWLSANTTPDYRSLARFRRRHEAALGKLFQQVLVLCHEAGLLTLGRVALDGTKLRASASKRKSMSYARLGPRIEELEAEVAAMLQAAEATDAAEDAAYGVDTRGDELPEELRRRETRLAKMRQAKEALEAEAKARAEATARPAEPPPIADAEAAIDPATISSGPRGPHRPSPKAQRSFTDPEARMMKTNDGFQFAYNAQAVVDEGAQVILATRVTQAAGDTHELLPMIEATTARLASLGITRSPRVLLADAGYCSEANLASLEELHTNALVATGRMRHHERVAASPRGRIPKDATRRERMARRLRTKAGRIDYARRKAIIEPVFGQMKVRQHAGYLRLRGLRGAETEWMLHSICHNLRKLLTAGVPHGLATT